MLLLWIVFVAFSVFAGVKVGRAAVDGDRRKAFTWLAVWTVLYAVWVLVFLTYGGVL